MKVLRPCFPPLWLDNFASGSKFNHEGTAGFSPFHLPGQPFLTHSHLPSGTHLKIANPRAATGRSSQPSGLWAPGPSTLIVDETLARAVGNEALAVLEPGLELLTQSTRRTMDETRMELWLTNIVRAQNSLGTFPFGFILCINKLYCAPLELDRCLTLGCSRNTSQQRASHTNRKEHLPSNGLPWTYRVYWVYLFAWVSLKGLWPERVLTKEAPQGMATPLPTIMV